VCRRGYSSPKDTEEVLKTLFRKGPDGGAGTGLQGGSNILEGKVRGIRTGSENRFSDKEKRKREENEV